MAEKNLNATTKIWNKVFINMFIINMMFHMCTTMMSTLTSKYADFLGGTATIVGMASGIFAATALIFKIISAPAIDSLNKKYVLLGGIGIMTAAFVGYTFSYSIPMLITSRLVQGAGQAFTTTGCLAIASTSLPNEKMTTGIGYYALSTAICRAIGPTLGLKMVDTMGYNSTFAVLTGIMLLTIVFTATMKLEHRKVRKFKINFHSIVAKEAVIPAVILLVIILGTSMIRSFLVLFSEQQGIGSNIGYFFTVSAFTLMGARPLIGRLADKYGVVKVMVPSLLLIAASFVLISFSSSLWMFLAASVIFSLGQGGTQPSMQATIMKSVPIDRRGSASCTTYLAMDLGTLVGPVIGGFIIELVGYTVTWRLMLIPIFIGLLLVIGLRKKILAIGCAA